LQLLPKQKKGRWTCPSGEPADDVPPPDPPSDALPMRLYGVVEGVVIAVAIGGKGSDVVVDGGTVDVVEVVGTDR
jgi:hypothetical protein